MAIKGAEKLMKQLSGLGNISPVLVEAVRRETLRVQRNAIMLCPVNHGELRQSIKTKVDANEGMVRGTVYTNKNHAPYVEFGTGPVGQSDHAGISPEVSPAYTQKGWWFPGDNVTEQDAQKYHWPSMTAEDGKTLYLTQGQPAQPFMYPALHQSEDIITRNIKKAASEAMREV